MDLARVSIGLPGATPHDVIETLASQIEAAGFRGLWLNDTPGGDSLAGLSVAARVTSTLHLGTGVIPLDRRSATGILSALGKLPTDRLSLGIGVGSAKHGLELIRISVQELRAATTASIIVGALGPKMRALGASIADGLLFNWLTPAAAAEAMAELEPPVRGVLYARTALSRDALPALRVEAARYGSYPSYAANFTRIGATPIDTTIQDIAGIEEYAGIVDELVLRVITREPTLDEYQRFLDIVK